MRSTSASFSSAFVSAIVAALALAPAIGAQNFDHPGEVWFDGRWGKPAEAEAAGWFEYRDRWLPKSIEPKLRQWEKEDAKGLAWNRSYTLKTRHYQLRTNVPRFVAELELRPFLDALYAHFTVTFRERFGLEGKGANMKTVNVYAGYATYFAQTQRPRSNPGYIVGGAELHVLYEDANLGGFYQTMFHEGAHQFVAGLMPGATLPHWMNEALATHFEAFTWSRATQTIRELAAPPDRLELAKHQLARVAEADPEQLFMRLGQADYNGFHYALGWSYLHFLLHVDAGRLGARFGALLKALNGSGAKPFEVVFRSIYKEELAALASRWKPYVLELPQPDRCNGWCWASRTRPPPTSCRTTTCSSAWPAGTCARRQTSRRRTRRRWPRRSPCRWSSPATSRCPACPASSNGWPCRSSCRSSSSRCCRSSATRRAAPASPTRSLRHGRPRRRSGGRLLAQGTQRGGRADPPGSRDCSGRPTRPSASAARSGGVPAASATPWAEPTTSGPARSRRR